MNIFDTMIGQGRQMFLDGMMQGKPLGETVVEILEAADKAGEEFAKISESFYAGIDCDDFNQLSMDAVTVVVDGLFDSKGLKNVIRDVVTMGMAFGFHNAKQNMKYAAIISLVNQLKVEAAQNSNKASSVTVEEFFQQVFALMDKNETNAAINFVREILAPSTGSPIYFNTADVPSFKKFVDNYSKLVLG